MKIMSYKLNTFILARKGKQLPKPNMQHFAYRIYI